MAGGGTSWLDLALYLIARSAGVDAVIAREQPVSNLHSAVRSDVVTQLWVGPVLEVVVDPQHEGVDRGRHELLLDEVEETVFETNKRPTNKVAFSRAEDQVFALHDGYISVYDVQTGQAIRQMGEEIRSAAFAPAAFRVWSADKSGVLSLWDLRSGAVVETFPEDGRTVGAIALSQDGSRALSTSASGTLRVWDLPKPPPPAPAKKEGFNTLDLSRVKLGEEKKA